MADSASPKFYMAAGLLWVLDASINVSMEPFRAYVADKAPGRTARHGFSMQSFFIGVGAVVAGMLPLHAQELVRRQRCGGWFENALPTNVKISFYLGAPSPSSRRALDNLYFQRISARESGGVPSQKPRAAVSPICSRKFPMRSGRCRALMKRLRSCSSSPGSVCSACGCTFQRCAGHLREQ